MFGSHPPLASYHKDTPLESAIRSGLKAGATLSVPLTAAAAAPAIGALAGRGLEAAAAAQLEAAAAEQLQPAAAEDIVSFAKNLQGSGAYPGVDTFSATRIQQGTVIYGGAPGQSNFYIDVASFERTGGVADILARGTQVAPHPTLGYRPGVTAYLVKQDVEAAVGVVAANPQHGPGGLVQIVIRNPQDVLQPLYSIPMSR